MGIKLFAEPVVEPISLEEAKQHLRVTSSDSDELIGFYIRAARQGLDGRTGWLDRSLITQTWELTLDRFPVIEPILLIYPPVQSIVSVSYVDGAGGVVVMPADGYDVDLGSEPARLWSSGWPDTARAIGVVSIRYVAGYGDDGEAVPWSLRAAMLLMIGDMYAHREANVERSLTENPAVKSLLNPFRVWSV